MAKIIITLIVALLVTGTAGHFANADTGGYSAPSQARKCFPLIEWNAEPGLRPCVRIVRLYEDGSFKYAVSDHDGTVRYSGGVGAADR